MDGCARSRPGQAPACGLRRSAGPVRLGGPVCAGPRDQTSVRAVRTACIGAARRRVPRLRTAGIRPSPALGGHRRLGAAVHGHGALWIAGTPGRSPDRRPRAHQAIDQLRHPVCRSSPAGGVIACPLRQNDGVSAAVPAGPGIFLNGTSSSGKSSIAEQLLLVLDRPFFHMSVDVINGMRARERTLELGPDELAAVLRRTRAGFHRAVAGMAQAGNDLVVDYVLSEQWRMLDWTAWLCWPAWMSFSSASAVRHRSWRGGKGHAVTGSPGRRQASSGRCTPTAAMTSNATPPRPVPATAPCRSSRPWTGCRSREPLTG